MVSSSYACLILQDGKVTIIGLRCNMGTDTESGYRHCVAAELGMKYEDVLIQEQHALQANPSLVEQRFIPDPNCGCSRIGLKWGAFGM